MPKLIPFIFLVFLSTQAYAASLSECKALVNDVNKSMPKKVDKDTIIKSVGCFDGKPPTIQYVNQVNVNASKNLTTTVKNTRPSQLKSWCNTPSLRAVMKQYNIEYKYIDKKGQYIASNKFNQKQCT